jgi:hypothetical protein
MVAEEGAYPEAAEAAGSSSSSGFKSPLLQVGCVICALFFYTCFKRFCKGVQFVTPAAVCSSSDTCCSVQFVTPAAARLTAVVLVACMPLSDGVSPCAHFIAS